MCLAFTTLIAALGVLLVDVIKHRTDFWTDMKAEFGRCLHSSFIKGWAQEEK